MVEFWIITAATILITIYIQLTNTNYIENIIIVVVIIIRTTYARYTWMRFNFIIKIV